MQKIVPNIWCQGNADEVGNFYAATFPDTSMEVSASYPKTNLPDFQQALAGQPLVVDVTLSGSMREENSGPHQLFPSYSAWIPQPTVAKRPRAQTSRPCGRRL